MQQLRYGFIAQCTVYDMKLDREGEPIKHFEQVAGVWQDVPL